MAQIQPSDLFVSIALVSLPLAWIACQLNWIRQRHLFLQQGFCTTDNDDDDYIPHAKLPWQLSLFGETRQWRLHVEQSKQKQAQELFPEAIINPPLRNSQN